MTMTRETATRQVANFLKENHLDAGKFIANFPERPSTSADLDAMMSWLRGQVLPATEGIYRRDGKIYKVVHAIYGSGHPYAKLLDVSTRKFVAAPGAVRKLRQADRMSTQEAAEFGKLYGFCVRCAAILTDEDSIERGMGPVCSTKI